MPTSGTYLWNPQLADMVDESFERCKVDPATLEHRHILSARRSINYMLADWATRSFLDFRIVRRELVLVEDQALYTLSGEVIDIVQMVLRRSGYDTNVIPETRSSWLAIPNKTDKGRVDRYFADKRRDEIELSVWPVPDGFPGDSLFYDCVLRYEDADQAAQNPDVPYYAREAFCAGLAARLAAKFAPPEIEGGLLMKAEDAVRRGLASTRELGDVRLIPAASRGRGRVR